MTQQSAEMEQRRADFAALRAELLAAGYHEEQRTVTIKQASLYALLSAGPWALLCLALYLLRWGMSLADWRLADFLLALSGVTLCIPLHEVLHGLAWGLCCRHGFKSIRFGFMREYLTPYCHCREALPWAAYLAGALVPFVLLGLGVFALAWAKGNAVLLILSLFNIMAAGGDTTVACMLLRHRHAVVLDHPFECGFVAFER